MSFRKLFPSWLRFSNAADEKKSSLVPHIAKSFSQFAALALIPFVLTGQAVLGATWYMDGAATGANNGTSWANAWVSPASINWANVNPGDTLYLSGGAYGGLGVAKSGTSNAPITIRVSQEAGHNSAVVLQGLSLGANEWITIDGSRSPSFQSPTNVFQDFIITNNIGLWLTSTNGSALYMTGPVGIHVYYLGITNVIRGAATFGYGIWANMTRGGVTDNNVFRYCWIDTVEDDGIGWTGNEVATHFDQQDIGFSVIRYIGDDGFEVNHGWSIHDCVIGPSRDLHGHPDGIQSAGSYFKIYNNIFYDLLNSAMRIQMLETNSHDVLIYNNLIDLGKVFVPGVANGNVGIEIAQYASNRGEQAFNVWSNIVVANNTLYTTNAAMNGGAISWSKRDEAYPADFVHNIVLTNSVFANNLFFRRNSKIQNLVGGGISWQTWRTNVSWGTMINYATEAANVCDFNTFSGTYAGDKAISYFGTIYTSGEAMAAASMYKHNKSVAPVFVSEGDNFELATNDTAALNLGTNLSRFFDYDILYRPRNVGGAWDRGAFERQSDGSTVTDSGGSTNGLQVWLNFEDDFSDGRIDDASGSGNHGWRFGRPGSVYPTNFPVRVLASGTPGDNTNQTVYCGDFRWWTNSDYGLYRRDGTYAAITNVAAFTNLSEMTISVWARYDTTKRINSGYDFSQDGNSTLISAGTSTAVIGSWDLGRFNQALWINNTRFMVVTNSNLSIAQVGNGSDPVFEKAGRIVFNFPDNGYSNGDTFVWHHYAVTFNNGLIRTYFDGTNVATADISSVTKTTTVGWNPSVGVNAAFIGIGCNTHGGTPALEDEPGEDYPNHGWFNGQMDDVRIYNRALTASEISAFVENASAKLRAPAGLRVTPLTP